MAIIYTYPSKLTPVADDLIILSDTESNLTTKKATLSSLKPAIGVNDYDLNATADGLNVDLNLTSSLGVDNSQVKVVAGSNITLTRDNSAQITIDAASGDTYDLNAGAKTGTKVPLNLTSGSGTDNSTVNLAEGANITLTQVSPTEIQIESTGGGSGSALTVSQDGVAVDTDVTDLNFISGFAAVDDAITAGKVDVNAVYNTSLSDAIATTEDFGGIPSGTTVGDLKGDTFVSIFDELLFPTALPEYTIPTRTLTSSTTGNREIGSTIATITLEGGGNKNDAGAYTDITITKTVNGGAPTTLTSGAPTENPTSNLPAQFGFANANNPNKQYTKSVADTSVVIPAPTSGFSSSIVYGSTANYNAGLALKDSKGVDDVRPAAVRTTTGPQAASTGFASGNRTITGFYPIYYLKDNNPITDTIMANAIQAGTATQLTPLASGEGNISIPYNISNQFLAIAYPALYTTKTKYFVTNLDQGAITAVFNAVTTQNVTSPLNYWTNISYKIHTSNSSLTNSNPTITLKNN